MPSREFWDCIGGAGAAGYTFRPNHDGVLPPAQNVYAPPKPAGWTGVAATPPRSGSASIPEPPPPPPAAPAHIDRAEALDELAFLHAFYGAAEGLQRPGGLTDNGRPDFEGIVTWFLDVYQASRFAGLSRERARHAYVEAIKASEEWKVKHPNR
jgi:hypothetical protein